MAAAERKPVEAAPNGVSMNHHGGSSNSVAGGGSSSSLSSAAARRNSSRIEAFLSSQKAFLELYGESLEQSLGFAVYLIPIEDSDDDVAGFANQAAYSVLELFTAYRTTLTRSADSLPIACLEDDVARPSAEEQLRVRRRQYVITAFMLRALRSLQVLCEMRATLIFPFNPRVHRVDRALIVCFSLEVVKMCLKITLRSVTRCGFYIDEDCIDQIDLRRDEDAAPERALTDSGAHDSHDEVGNGAAVEVEAPELPREAQFVGRRSGRTLPSLHPGSQTSGCGGSKRLDCDAGATEDVAAGPGCADEGTEDVIQPLPPSSSVLSPSQQRQVVRLSEALHLGRPLLHLLCLMWKGRESWIPWLLALIMDYSSMQLLGKADVWKRAAASTTSSKRLVALQQAELRRRASLLWYGLVRSPFFNVSFQKILGRLNERLKQVYIIKYFNIVEFWLALQRFYFTTSGS